MSAPEVSRATNEFLAEELAAEAKATEQAQEVAAALNPPPPAPAAAPAAPEAPGVKLNPKHLHKLATVLLTVSDRIIVAQAGKAYALTADEKEEIAGAAVPVIEKYLPSALGWLVTTPEGVLLGTVAIVYGSKLGVDVTGLVGSDDEPTATTEAPPATEEKAP
jgi:hypothetical protein